MNILGLNAYHGDSSACVLKDGELVAAVEEERFRRIRHWAGFPAKAVAYCLNEAGLEVSDIDHVAINRDPKANLMKKALFTFRKHPSLGLITDRLKNAMRVRDIREVLCDELGIDAKDFKAQIHNVEHHVAHMASSFFVSPYEKAAVISVDGFGDFVGAMWGIGQGGDTK